MNIKGHLEFQEIQEVGERIVRRILTRIVPDEDGMKKIARYKDMTGSMRDPNSNELSEDGKTITGYVKTKIL